MSIDGAIADTWEVDAYLRVLLEACRKVKKDIEDEEKEARRGDGNLPGPGAGLGNMFGIAIFTEGYRITQREWNRTGEHGRWGDQSRF